MLRRRKREMELLTKMVRRRNIEKRECVISLTTPFNCRSLREIERCEIIVIAQENIEEQLIVNAT